MEEEEIKTVEVNVNHLNIMLGAMNEHMSNYYQGVFQTLIRSIIAHLLPHESKSKKDLYEDVKKYPYIRDNLPILDNYSFEQFCVDCDEVSNSLADWKRD
jgi:hypothetical protein